MTPADFAMPHDIAAHATSAAMIVYVIDWLKKNARITWLNENSATLNRLTSALFALVIALGISATGDVDTGWVIKIPALGVLVNGLWEFGQQFILQQVIYDWKQGSTTQNLTVLPTLDSIGGISGKQLP